MLLIACGTDGDVIRGHVVSTFLEEYFLTCEGDSALADPEVCTMLDWARPDTRDVELWPLDRYIDIPRLTGA
jgi:hypothetical protein